MRDTTCPICKQTTGNYTEHNFCVDCFNSLKKLFLIVNLFELAKGLQYLSELADKKEGG